MSAFEFIVLLIIVGCALKGLREGLILSVCSLLTFFLAIGITQTVTPILSQQVQQNEQCVNYISGKVEQVLNTDNNKDRANLRAEKKQEQADEIRQLPIPNSLKKLLISNNNVESYKAVGAESFKKYLSRYITFALINCICYFVVFIFTVFVLKFAVHALDIVSKLPVIHTLNKCGGLLAGGIKGLLIVWLIFVAVIICSGTTFGAFLTQQIDDSPLLKFLYDNNIILNVIVYIMEILL